MQKADVIQIIIGILSLISTISLSIVLYVLEAKRINRDKKIEDERRKTLLEYEAEKFIITNGDEIDYLPLCVFANNLNKIKKHKRDIYNNYNLCSDEVKKIILEKRNIFIKKIPNDKWYRQCVELLRKDVEKYELGRSVFYENAKYVERCMEFYSDNSCKGFSNEEFIFEDYHIDENKMVKRGSHKTSLFIYISRYLEFKEDTRKYDNTSNVKYYAPCDYVWNMSVQESEEIYCYWNALLMRYICMNIREYNSEYSFISGVYSQVSDLTADSFEDLYYLSLYELYLTYGKNIE